MPERSRELNARGSLVGCRGFFASALLLAMFFLGGCASGPPSHDWPSAAIGKVPQEIEEVPFFPQERYQCGPAALAGVLNWSGVATTPDELSPYLYIPERQGTLQPELLAQSRRLGRVPYVIPEHPDALLLELESRHPVLVLQNNGLSWYPQWHYAVVVGVETDEDGDERVVLRSGDMERYPLEADTFMNTWRRSNYWGVVVLPPGELPVSAGPASVLQAIEDFARVADFEAVMTALDAAGERWPEHPGVQFALGNHRYAGGDIAGAERHYRKGIAADPSAAMLRNNLAWLLAEQGEIAEAREQVTLARLANDGYQEDIAHTAAFIECRAEGGDNAGCLAKLEAGPE